MAFVTDSMTGTAGTALESHTGETGATWTEHTLFGTGAMVISDANRVRPSNNNPSLFLASGTPATAEYDVTVTLRQVTSANQAAGVVGRASNIADTSYRARYRQSTLAWQLHSTVAGVVTLLGTFGQTLVNGTDYALKLELRNATKKVFVDGVERISSADNAITAAGLVGVTSDLVTTTNTTGYHLDAFSADNVGGATFAPVIVSASTVAAAVKSRALLTPTVMSAATVSATLRSRALLAPSVVAAGGVAAGLRSRALLSPTVVAGVTATAAITSRALISPTVASASTVTAEVSVPGEALFTVTVVAASSMTAAVMSRALMSPTVAATSIVTAAVTTPGIVPTFSVTVVSGSTVAAALRSPALFVPLIVGSTTTSAAITSRALFAPTIAAAAVVAVALRSRALIAVTVTGALVVTAAFAATRNPRIVSLIGSVHTIALTGSQHVIALEGSEP